MLLIYFRKQMYKCKMLLKICTKEFRVQQEAIEELKRQFNQLQLQVAQVSQNELITQENERLKDQLANMSQVMANIQYKVNDHRE